MSDFSVNNDKPIVNNFEGDVSKKNVDDSEANIWTAFIEGGNLFHERPDTDEYKVHDEYMKRK